MSRTTRTRWTPSGIVSKKAVKGRRAFGSKIFETKDAVLRYKIDVFLDRRDCDLSVDRLGVHEVDKKVVSFLRPLCEAMANKGSTTFHGWVQLRVGDLRSDVKNTEAYNEDNPYHAEIDRSAHASLGAKRSFAFELCVIASKNEFVYKS